MSHQPTKFLDIRSMIKVLKTLTPINPKDYCRLQIEMDNSNPLNCEKVNVGINILRRIRKLIPID